MTEKIQVKLNKGTLTLVKGAKRRTWQVDGEVTPSEMGKAQKMADEYQESPANGYPGCYLASLVADALEGEVAISGIPEGRKDVIY